MNDICTYDGGCNISRQKAGTLLIKLFVARIYIYIYATHFITYFNILIISDLYPGQNSTEYLGPMQWRVIQTQFDTKCSFAENNAAIFFVKLQ